MAEAGLRGLAARLLPPHRARAEVRVQVVAAEGDDRAAVDVAAGDGAVAAGVVRVGAHREPQVAAVDRLALVDGESLVVAPAEARPRRRAVRDPVDLLVAALADVADVEVAVRPVEREAPRVAQPERVDPGRRREPADVHPQDLAEPRVRVECPLLGVALAAAVAQPDVQPAARTERDVPAVVVRVGLVDTEVDPHVERVQAIGAARVVGGHTRVAGPVGVRDEDPVVGLVAGVEGHRQQSLLPACGDPVGDVQERPLEQTPVLQDADRAALEHDEDAARVARRGGHEQRVLEALGDQRQAEAAGLCGRRQRE